MIKKLYNTVVVITQLFHIRPISCSLLISALGSISGWYRHSSLIYGLMWKPPCDNL